MKVGGARVQQQLKDGGNIQGVSVVK